jgi:hypothetical protein
LEKKRRIECEFQKPEKIATKSVPKINSNKCHFL